MKLGPAFAAKLTDFSHIKMFAGEGPNGGASLGMNTTFKLLDGRTRAIQIKSA